MTHRIIIIGRANTISAQIAAIAHRGIVPAVRQIADTATACSRQEGGQRTGVSTRSHRGGGSHSIAAAPTPRFYDGSS